MIFASEEGVKRGLGYLTFYGGLVAYSLFSFTLVDPNLILSSNPLYWDIQNWLWQWVADHRMAFVLLYLVIIGLIFTGYILILVDLRETKAPITKLKKLLVAAIACLIFSYPALSHDVFNYAFNAKMVIHYQANPHVRKAWEFPEDHWLKYMHNIHTSAPYGYGWTGLSLIPYLLGRDDVKQTLLIFRLFNSIYLIILLCVCYRIFILLKTKPVLNGISKLPVIEMTRNSLMFSESEYGWRAALLLLNPLVLIESVGNIHNDVAMILLAYLSLWLLLQSIWFRKWLYLAPSVIAIIFSFSIKFVTIILIADLFMLLIFPFNLIKNKIAELASLSMFLPLLTKRSQRFLAWYLIWPISWIPFYHSYFFRYILIAFSASALLAYAPSLLVGGYNEQIVFFRSFVSFSIPVVVFSCMLIIKFLNILKVRNE